MRLLLLHGYDSSVERMMPIEHELRVALPGATVASIEGFVTAGAETRGWWPATAEPAEVQAAVRALSPALGTDGALVAGFSQGGALGLAAAARDDVDGEARVLGVVCVAGFLPPGVELRAGGPPLLLLHGEDDEVVDVFYAETLARAARRIGIDVELQTYPGGHEWPSDGVTRISRWLRERSLAVSAS